MEATPDAGTGEATVPINAVATLPAGNYFFAIRPFGSNLQLGTDYTGYCELTVVAYTGLGPDINVQAPSLDRPGEAKTAD